MTESAADTPEVEAPTLAAPEEPGSIFQSALPIEAKRDRARMELLDLSARNRLLNMPRSGKSAKILEVVDERSSEIFRLLVGQNRVFTFLPGRVAANAEGVPSEEDPDEIAELAQPEDDGIDERGVANRHSDTRLQTRMTPAGLQKRLLDLYYDARTLEEEQGVNILFLALGSLRWVDPNNDKLIRHAPLVLVPVSLERGNAAEKFKLRWRSEDVAANLSLEAFLDRVHGIRLPTFEAGEDFDITKYVAAVAEAVRAKAGWAVNEDDIVLGFFSFAKFLMYRDLDPSNWPKDTRLSEHDIIRPLVSDGFEADEEMLAEDVNLDQHIAPAELLHIVDSDSSQSLAIHEIRKGRNLVIQGPPGTGKSQTIANLIAAAVADGKTVLFVAEKMAALEVVKRRLDNAGVGDMCLELHSNKANKRAVLEELKRTWELGAPRGDATAAVNARLSETRDTLNKHARRLHAPTGAAGFTPFQVIGHLTRLRHAGQLPNDLKLENPEEWTQEQLEERSRLVDELADRVTDIGVPANHVWRGIGLRAALPADVDRFVHRISGLIEELGALGNELSSVAQTLEVEVPQTLGAIEPLALLAERVAGAPELEPAALGSTAWDDSAPEIIELIAAGTRYKEVHAGLCNDFQESAWHTDLAVSLEALAPLPNAVPIDWFAAAARLLSEIPSVLRQSAELAKTLGRTDTPQTIDDIRKVLIVGQRVASAPDADPAALAADLWNSGIERAADLATAVDVLERSRAEVGTGLSPAAWQADLDAARQTLAAHGSSFFRYFSGEWRSANRLVRSYLSSAKTPLEDKLALLDALARGQAALDLVERENEFGSIAFGSDWRANRSSPGPLLAIVEWMRSLTGLGTEPRMIASQKPDRRRIGSLAEQLAEVLRTVELDAGKLWRDLVSDRSPILGSAVDADQSPLTVLAEKLTPISNAHQLYTDIAITVPDELDIRKNKLAALDEGQQLARRLEDNGQFGKQAFGPLWEGPATDWPRATDVAEWITSNLDIHAVASRVADKAGVAAQAEATIGARGGFLERLEALLVDLMAGPDAAIAPSAGATIPVEQLQERLRAWVDHSEQLSKWAAYCVRVDLARAAGMGDLVARLHDGRLQPGNTRAFFEMGYFEAAFRDQVNIDPELAQFDGDLHDRTVKSFVDLDLQRIKLSALEVARAHHRKIPSSFGGAVGPLGVLKSEIARKRGHMPIRQVMQKAGPAIQSLKPVFMMSPLSVAQFLQPGGMSFDLLVMDEASQIQPVDALGAIARCRQVVVVGDPQQLPPTAFFSKLVGGSDDDDADDGAGAARVGDIESILGLFTARGLPMRMLRWHYRSRHQSLIAVSNRQFYENKLFIVPSPFLEGAGVGLRFHHIENGIFESGTTRTNPVEAKAVARAIVAHAVANPELSLGVAAFSAAQRRAILDQLEILRRALPPEQEAFFQSHPAEPFFIKNLENVQGDERDVIFISVGYGPTAPGLKPPMRFGPLGAEGGERRLNVLISRAKRRCEVFASMTDEDIDPDFASARKGVFAFKLFMHFARTGRLSMAEPTARDHDSVFEEQVADALQAQGYQVHRQVGIAGFVIDLAVADPEHADRYLLGIECDGAAYHEARSARDRDRLRQAVLEDHGWIIHRIWSTDWFRRPREQLDRVVKAIESAKLELEARRERGAAKRASLEVVTVDRGDVTEMGLATVAAPASSLPYIEAAPKRPSHVMTELHDTPTGVLSAMAEEVVNVEGPVHLDEIINRLRDAWGLRRAGGRIQDAVERALSVSVRQNRVVENDEFYWRPGTEPVVRDRSSASSASLRRPEMLPPTEIRAALAQLVSDNFGATDEQCVVAVSRAFGFKSTSAQLREVIVDELNASVADQVLISQEGLIRFGPNAPVRAVQCPEPSAAEQLIQRGEGECIEFKQSLRWDVRQNALNTKLEDVVVKTIAAFANRIGGTLLIGVADDGSVQGIEPDVATFAGSLDKLELHLTNVLTIHFGQAFKAAKLSVAFPRVADRTICRVDVQRSRTPIWVKLADRAGNVTERLFVRSGNSSQELSPSQAAAYEREHFA